MVNIVEAMGSSTGDYTRENVKPALTTLTTVTTRPNEMKTH